jgi:hypothetical protein
MNTLVLLLMTTIPGADPAPIVQPATAPAPAAVSPDTGETWWGRFRHRQGLFSRLRGWFGKSHEDVLTAPGLPSTVKTVPGPMEHGRLVPTPVDSPMPSVTYGTAPYRPGATVETAAPPQAMPTGNQGK